MVPRIHAKFRRRNGVPYAVEQLSGRQFRCRHCDELFLSEKDLDRHIRQVIRNEGKKPAKVSPKAPALSSSVTVRALYTYDIMDKMKRQWLKLKRGDEYDGI
jgi:hypothetical protein